MVIFPFVTFYNEFEQKTSLRRGHVSKNLKERKRRAMQQSGSEAFQEEGTVRARSSVWLEKTGWGTVHGNEVVEMMEGSRSHRALGFYIN